MIRCIVVDDKPLAIDILNDYVGKVPDLSLVFSSTNPLEALEYVMKNDVDLVFLDIQMPQLNGVQFMKIVSGKCKVVLTTAYSEYALDGFENDAIDYLLKPISFERFYKAVQKAQHYFDSVPQVKVEQVSTTVKEKDFIFVKTEYKLVKINTEDILYVEGMQNYVAIHTKTEKIMSLQNIKKTEEQLPKKQFVRVHKSYIVAVNKIVSIERSRIYIGDAIIPLGDVYKDEFYNIIEAKN
ncbi:LytR/AlgR family response regulator transcription factor [Pedobacter nototheniae]|uniref:LytR/AlgR family response regulator transcription factor n=1 Tax=Pedobacter nototheniae TaxID=2488994 RepID=UPI00103BEFDF|nr:LytTR family DNA-binding domain-containing protein [Pedobacter nototheniae]